MKKLGMLLGAIAIAAVLIWIMIGQDWRRFLAQAPYTDKALEWNFEQRSAAFRMMDKVPFLVKSRGVFTSVDAKPLPIGTPLDLNLDIDAFMETNDVVAVVILKDGKIAYESYRDSFTADRRWTSFSVAKSFTSTLVGVAIQDGLIDSVDDNIAKYLTGLKGSAYDGVSIEQLLTMSSGVAWNEDYEDPQSDVSRVNNYVAPEGGSNIVSYLSKLERAHEPGTHWNYSTGETNLIGELVQTVTGKSMAEYLTEKVWTPYAMQQDASWLLNNDGGEISGCCIQATTRDFAKFGQFIMEGGKVDGQPILPDWWLERATTKRMPIGTPGEGYGYQWWTFDTGAFRARGIFGQGIYVDPSRNLVIATNSNWRNATGTLDGERAALDQFFEDITAELDQ